MRDAVDGVRVGQWSPYGLGIKNSPYDNSHTIDNAGWDDFLVFNFSEVVSLDAIKLGYIANDSDVTIAYLGNNGFEHAGDIFNAGSYNEVNPLNYVSDTWVIGAFSTIFSDASYKFGKKWDGFKLKKIEFTVSEVPLPAAFWFMAVGIAGLIGARRKLK